jgi:hypothetical protein
MVEPVTRNALCRSAAAPVIEKYTGVLAAADVFTESTTFWVMESIRLDRLIDAHPDFHPRAWTP